MSLSKIYRVSPKKEYNGRTGRNFTFICQKRIKFFFLYFWTNIDSNSYYTSEDAEVFLKSYLREKYYVKYFCIENNLSIFDGETLIELEKKTKLKAFL
jgi:hypothetical protein